MSFKAYKISVVVPFHDEEKSIEHTAQVISNISYLDEIIFVNDASTDSSLQLLKPYLNRIRVISLSKQSGKAAAVIEGVKSAQGDILVFLDADLENLTESHVNSLLNPLLAEGYIGCVGYPADSLSDYFYIPVGGQRAYFRKNIEAILPELEKTRHYGIEPALNRLLANTRVKWIPLRGLGHRLKFYKNRHSRKMVKEVANWMYSIGFEYAKQGTHAVESFVKKSSKTL